ncbi:MAG: hypothetical protein U9Q21_02405 [Candidatus Auribacterota bacterium]|nr:hypothetical protein [Candidatus Auribacterota bacterium]
MPEKYTSDGFDGIFPQCNDCTRFYGNAKCAAFPQGIPKEIYFNDFDHKNEYPGDAGFRFKQKNLDESN